MKKNVKKALLVAAPLLWCGALYLGEGTGMGEVLARSVTTLTQTVVMTQTMVNTQTQVYTEITREAPSTEGAPCYGYTDVTTMVAKQKAVVKLTETVIELPDEAVITQTTPEEKPEEKPDTRWKPVTADEIKRASLVTKEKVEVRSSRSSCRVMSEMQGELCVAAMENALKDGYTLGATYSIFYTGSIEGADKLSKKELYAKARNVYESEAPVSITMSIPKDLQKEGRKYEMICVSENGKTYNIPAEVNEDGSITFETKYFYAFGLAYTDK